MTDIKYAVPDYITSKDIKRVRRLINMTQKEFAKLVGCSKPTIERWESSDGKITGPIVLLVNMLDANPEYVKKIEIPKKEFPLRLYYMHNQKLCSVIDVDDLKQEVKVYDYTNHIMFKAFGNNNNPSYDDYQEFLKSRCFPESRDKLKLVLNDLNIPFYDPFMIVKKTEGKMAEDDFWIKVEE